MKNFLTQGETNEKNQKIGGGVPIIDRKFRGCMMLIDKKLAELKNYAECESFSKFIELIKKPFNQKMIKKEKHHCPTSHSLAYFIELVRWPCFRFIEGLTGLIDGLAMGGVKSNKSKIAVGFSK